MLAGSLDGHVKVFELNNFKVTSASKYPAPVLSMGISPDCSLLAVGMADGMLSVRKHARPKPLQVRGIKIYKIVEGPKFIAVAFMSVRHCHLSNPDFQHLPSHVQNAAGGMTGSS